MFGLQSDMAELVAIDAVAGTEGCEVVVCVPATLLSIAAATLRHVAVGAQDCHAADTGACTGQLSARMLAEAGARWAIVGHSECRAAMALTDADVARKATASSLLLQTIVCVGDDSADAAARPSIVAGQLAASLADTTPERLVVAYEPVWAIGSGRTPTVQEIVAVLEALRSTLADRFSAAGDDVRLLYGGSVDGSNARAILAEPIVDGLLVGGASRKTSTFTPIVALGHTFMNGSGSPSAS